MKTKESKEVKKNVEGVEEDLSSVGVFPHVSDGIFVRNGNYYCKILYTDILWLGAYNNYCEIHKKDGKTYCAVHPLIKVEKNLPPDLFVRIHRSYIVNIHEVDRFIGNMVYIGKQRLDVSRPYRKIFSCFDVLEDCRKKAARMDNPAIGTENSAIPIKK